MKSAVSLALSICLVSSALPVAAQDRIVATPGPIARAITREAVRLGTVQQVGKATDSDWARVRKLTPGTAITVTIRGSQGAKRYFVSADYSGVTVLNITDPTVPAVVKRVLLDTASNHFEYFAGAQNGGRFLLDKDVGLASDGVFVGSQKVADLGQVLEKAVRTDIVEVRSESARRHPAAGKGALIGAIGGAAIPIAIGSTCGSGCIGYTALYAALFGGLGAGIGAGIGLGIDKSSPETGVIYLAP
jgi:hypothetical protein